MWIFVTFSPGGTTLKKEQKMKIAIFSPAFNVGNSILSLIEEMADVDEILSSRGHQLEFLVINDASRDSTGDVLREAEKYCSWLRVITNEKNLGNAENIITGYRWGLRSGADVIGCIDADGEHSPYAMIRHIRMIERGECDGVVGSIIFPDHDANHHDRNMMRFWGGMQAEMAGIDGLFYIQSPGYNLHQSYRVERALEMFEEYKKFFGQNSGESFPRWGLHGVLIHLISVGTGAHIKAAYLECFGQSPNRDSDKLLKQANAANQHSNMLAKFMPRRR